MTDFIVRALQFFIYANLMAVIGITPSLVRAGDGPTTLASIFQSKDKSMGSVAREIAKIHESFVVGGMDFSADGAQLAINPMVDGYDVHIWSWRPDPHIVRVLHREAAPGAGNAIRFSPNGELLAAAHGLVNGVAFNMEILAQCFERIAPTRRLQFGAEDPQLASTILRAAAKSYLNPDSHASSL